jgi:hypothetical protein
MQASTPEFVVFEGHGAEVAAAGIIIAEDPVQETPLLV